MWTGVLYLTIGVVLFAGAAYASLVLTYSNFAELFKIFCWITGTFLTIISFLFWTWGYYFIDPKGSTWMLLVSYFILMDTPIYMISFFSLRKSRRFSKLNPAR